MKNTKRILLLTLLTLCLSAALAACGPANAFDGKGAAEIKLNLAEDYGEDLTVECPSGTIVGSGKSYTVSLKTRAIADVIVSCAGYETQTLSFKTADFESGSVSRDVTLVKKKILLTLSITGATSADDLKFELVNSVNAIMGSTLDKKKAVLELAAIADCTVKVSGEGYIENELFVKAADFVNYKASYTVPLLTVADNKACITFINDTDEDYTSYQINRFPYGQRVADAYLNGAGASKVTFLNKADYVISNGAEQIYLTVSALNANPYKVIYMSQFGTRPQNTGNYIELSPNKNSMNFRWDCFGVYDAQGVNISSGHNMVYLTVGSEITLVYAGEGIAASDVTFYKMTVPAASIIGINIGKKDDGWDKNFAYLSFNDEKNAPVSYGDITLEANGVNELVQAGYAEVLTDGRLKIDFVKLLNDNGDLPMLWPQMSKTSGYVQNYNYNIHWHDLIGAGTKGKTVTLISAHEVKLRFRKIDGTFDTTFNFGDADAQGYYSFANQYAGSNFEIHLPLEHGGTEYRSLTGELIEKGYRNADLSFVPALFRQGDAYQYTLDVYKEKSLALNISGMTFSTGNGYVSYRADKGGALLGNGGVDAAMLRVIRVDESMIGATLTFDASSEVEIPDHRDPNGKPMWMQWVQYQATAELTQEIFNSDTPTLNVVFKRMN